MKVLAIEDEAMLRELLGTYLTGKGYESLFAEDGKQGIGVFREERPPIVVTDIRMPGMDGIEVLKEVKKIDPDAEVIMITGYGDMEIAIKALQEDASDFIQKPFTKDVLEVALARAERKLAMKRQLKSYVEDMERKVRERTVELEKAYRELEKAYMELRELDQMKSDFISTVSHELRTPLTSIKAFAEILIDNPGEDMETQREFLNIINDETDRLTRLINDVLDLSKMESGKMEWSMGEVQLSRIIENAVAVMKVKADEKDIPISVNVPQGLPTICGDEDRLTQVVNNLLSNAIKFTDKDGRIEVKASTNEHPEASIHVSVSDTGMGIAREYPDKIFDKFRQGGNVLTDKPQGTGLGLAICQQIVEHHGGKIWVESQPGKGSTFYFTLRA